MTAFCLNAYTYGFDPNASYLVGLDYSHVKRMGFYDFPSLRKSQPLLARQDADLLGGSIGKRWKINNNIRLQACLGFEVGWAADDTLSLSPPGLVKSSFYHGSIEPVLQFPLSITGRTIPFLLIGGGADYMVMRKRTFALDNSIEYVYSELSDIYIQSGCFSVHAAAGFGFDYALSRNAMISMWYVLRYWQPIRYGIKEDFLLTAQRYHETFLDHHFHLSLLFDIR